MKPQLSRFVQRMSARFRNKIHNKINEISMDFESAASTIPPLGQTIACVNFISTRKIGARAVRNIARNIPVSCFVRSAREST